MVLIPGTFRKAPSLNANRNYLYPDRTESKIIEKDAIMAFALSHLLKTEIPIIFESLRWVPESITNCRPPIAIARTANRA